MTEKFTIESSENIIKARRLVVRTTSGDVEQFDSKKIIRSLIKETNINENVANKVTDLVLKRIINANIQWLSGPAIREMCCSVLAEIGLLEARKRYTRIGMPLMDYENYIEIGVKENANQYQNPMSIHSWCADRISSEYALLRLLREEESKAHLKGDIHIHMLRFFDLRPFCQEWDLRTILKSGLPPVNWPFSAMSKPAKHPIVAFLHAAKWLGLITGEFSGGLGYDNFTVFLAPYVRGLSEEEIEQLAQCYIFESNQIYASRGGQIPFTSISCVPTIPTSLYDVPAVSFEGKYDGVYGDYVDECNALFKALSKVYWKGDGIGRLFNFPKHEIKLKKEWINKFEEDYLLISEETAKFGNPYYLNMVADWMPDEVHSQCLPYNEPLISRIDGQISYLPIGKIVSDEFIYQNVDSKELDKSFWLKPKRKIDVLSIDPVTKKIDFQPVTNLFYKSEKSKIVTLFVDGGLKISTSENHPLIVMDIETQNLKIKRAKHIEIGDFILKMTGWDLNKFDTKNHNELDLIDFLIQNEKIDNITVYGFNRKILMMKNQTQLAKQLNVPKDRIGWWRRSNSISLKAYLKLIPDPKARKNIYLVPKGGKGRIKAKIMYDRNFMTFLGFYLAEGSIQKRKGIRLSFGSFETELIEETEKLIEEVFGLKAKRRYQIDSDKNYNHCNIEVNSHLLIDLIKYWNIGISARSKRLPDLVFQLPNELTGALIRSLFLGDGYIRNSQNSIEISLHVSSEELVQGVHYLLLRHGINSTINRRQKSVNLSIERGDSIKSFIQLIPEWNDIFDRYISEKKRYLPPISERVPSILIDKQKINNRVKKGIATQAQKQNRTIGKKFLQLIPHNARKPLLGILEQSKSFNLVRVNKIICNQTSDVFYDLEVGLLGKKGNFVHGDGLITHNCCRLILTPEGIRKICDDPDLFDWSKSYINLGSLQSVSLNLPRYAYQSNGDDDKFFDILDKFMELSKGILLIKRNIIKKRLESGLLPLCSRELDNGDLLLDLKKQSVNIGFVGLNECVQAITNQELHESNEAYKFGKRILQYMAKKCDTFTKENSFKFSLWEQPAECIKGNELVLICDKNKGIFELSEISNVKITPNSTTIGFNREGQPNEMRVDKLIKHSKRETYRIKCQHGFISVTSDHSLFTIDDQLNIIEIAGKDIKKGAILLMPRLIKITENKSPLDLKNCCECIEITDGEKGKNVHLIEHDGLKSFRFIEKTFDLGYILGQYIAEGSMNVVVITCGADKEEVEKIAYLVQKTFNFEHTNNQNIKVLNLCKHTDNRKSNYKTIYSLESKATLVKDIFTKGIGLKPVYSILKEIPPFLYNAPIECIKGFLAGFIKGDGSINDYKRNGTSSRDVYVRLFTSSYKLLFGLNFLLKRLGIVARVSERKFDQNKHPNWHDAYELRISGKKNLQILKRFIPEIPEVFGRDNAPAIDLNPWMKKLNTELKEKFGVSLRKLVTAKKIPFIAAKCAQPSFKRNISENALLVTLITLKKLNFVTPTVTKLINLFSKNTLSKILSIETNPIDFVYDLSIPENENFIAGIGQIYAHNSTAGRFAMLDLKHFPDKVIVQGNPDLDAVYYTNSDHLRYSADIPLFDRIKKQAEFHPIVQGGVITHVWLGESYPDPEGLWKLTKKIAFNTPTAYWAYTKDFTQCLACQKFLNGVHTICPYCGASSEQLEWWSRITGYYSRLTGWNASKIEEWKSRKRYNFKNT